MQSSTSGNIVAARETLRPPHTSILCHPLLSESYLRSSTLSAVESCGRHSQLVQKLLELCNNYF